MTEASLTTKNVRNGIVHAVATPHHQDIPTRHNPRVTGLTTMIKYIQMAVTTALGIKAATIAISTQLTATPRGRESKKNEAREMTTAIATVIAGSLQKCQSTTDLSP